MPAAAAPNSSDDPPTRAADSAEPAAVAATMASAVERLRRMAATVFSGDAALFAGPVDPGGSTDGERDALT